MASEPLPQSMRCLELRAYAEKPKLHVVVKPVPKPGRNEVLVELTAAPINPSDLMFLEGLYGVRKPLPVVPGFEGSGVVVATGSAPAARALMGRRVACSAPVDGDGTWAEYIRTTAQACVPLLPNVDLEPASMLIVNPLTAWALVDIAKASGSRALVQTAAASALGRMVIRLAAKRRLKVINVVRRKAQVEALRDEGAEHVLDSSARGFEESLAKLAEELGARIAFDAVSGPMTQTLAKTMPTGSRIVVYGGLAHAPSPITADTLIFRGITIEGFWLPKWREQMGAVRLLQAGVSVQRHLSKELRTEVRERVALEDAQGALERYAAEMTGGKFLLMPELEPTPRKPRKPRAKSVKSRTRR